ncbi:MAG TPA: DUF1572 family protein [Blastocatellia bacterium]|jgi:uncharacterized damage-inducible protein DinB|nr:DUF1572 family protein [Blastocatellia bacterium]
MADTTTLDQVALAAFRNRITKILPAQVRSCIEDLSEEQLWWRPNDKSNSVGNLVLHVSGSTRHYLSRSIGHMKYERDRPAEFSERGPVAKITLLAIFDETIAQAVSVLDAFETSRFTEPTEEPNYFGTVFEQILGITMHLATHTGQIVYATKMLKEGSVDELWIRAHKA